MLSMQNLKRALDNLSALLRVGGALPAMAAAASQIRHDFDIKREIVKAKGFATAPDARQDGTSTLDDVVIQGTPDYLRAAALRVIYQLLIETADLCDTGVDSRGQKQHMNPRPSAILADLIEAAAAILDNTAVAQDCGEHWVSPAQASPVFGKDRSTLGRWAKAGLVRSRGTGRALQIHVNDAFWQIFDEPRRPTDADEIGRIESTEAVQRRMRKAEGN